MNEGILQSSPAQQMVVAASNNWFSNNRSSPLLSAPPSNHIPHHLPPPLTAPLSWPASQELPHSCLGFAGEEDTLQLLTSSSITSAGGGKQENSAASYGYSIGTLEFTAAKSTDCLFPPMVSASSPKSCLTTSTMRIGFSDKSSEILMKCNSNNGANKKPKISPTPSQSGIKVRKERLGDRITALHQLASPFGKTDTASVLLEAIGYIRFLQSQIEALSQPYLGSGSGNTSHDQTAECDERRKKDLKSRGLCLVPVSCTVDFGSENNGADYLAPAGFSGSFQ